MQGTVTTEIKLASIDLDRFAWLKKKLYRVEDRIGKLSYQRAVTLDAAEANTLDGAIEFFHRRHGELEDEFAKVCMQILENTELVIG